MSLTGRKRKRTEGPRSLTSRRRKPTVKKLLEELEEAELPDVAELEAILGEVESTRTRKTRKRTPRKPTLKSTLVKKLRARKKVLKAELRAVERDLNSLICRRRKNGN